MTPMRSLADLLATAHGREFLAERGVLTDRDDFVDQLEAPKDDGLTTMVGLPPGSALVYVGQQVCADYAPGTVSKFAAATQLAGREHVAPAVLWHDADRAGSERYGMRWVLPTEGRPTGIRLAPKSLEAHELRFIAVGRQAVDQALGGLRSWVASRTREEPAPVRQAALARVAVLGEAVLDAPVDTLAQVNAAFANFLLAQRLGVRIPFAFLSEVLDRGLLSASVNNYLERIDDVIAVYNEAVAELRALDIDPLVRSLTPDHLPLHLSCPRDGTRLRLARRRAGDDHFAVAGCRCGSEYRFHLGRGTMSLGELAGTDRWSLDVSLPIHLNGHASGWVAGRSTALYGLVLNAVIARVFGGRPIPGWIPPELGYCHTPIADKDSLLVEYLLR
jgi:hypothetical protein